MSWFHDMCDMCKASELQNEIRTACRSPKRELKSAMLAHTPDSAAKPAHNRFSPRAEWMRSQRIHTLTKYPGDSSEIS